MDITSLVSIIFPDISGSLRIDFFNQSGFGWGFLSRDVSYPEIMKRKRKMLSNQCKRNMSVHWNRKNEKREKNILEMTRNCWLNRIQKDFHVKYKSCIN